MLTQQTSLLSQNVWIPAWLITFYKSSIKPWRKPSYKQIIKESDWKTYYGSNKHLLELLNNEPPENFKREILTLAPNKKLLTYEETKALFVYQVLENPHEFFNDNILGKFFTKDFESQK